MEGNLTFIYIYTICVYIFLLIYISIRYVVLHASGFMSTLVTSYNPFVSVVAFGHIDIT